MPHLWMFLLQSLTPKEHEVILIDGNAKAMTRPELVQFCKDENIGLIGIGAMTRMVARAYLVADALREAFLATDAHFMRSSSSQAGSTAVVALVTRTYVIVANAGDSRCVLWREGRVLPLSVDHKPDRPDELQRIKDAVRAG